MEWFAGSIIEAVQASKARKAFFVVYIEGTDDASKATTDVLDESAVAEKLKGKEFVCIKLLKDSPGHKQFAEIYQMVPVPSVFFIAQNGKASEVVVGNNERRNVESRINAAIQKCLEELKIDGTTSGVPHPVHTPDNPSLAAPAATPPTVTVPVPAASGSSSDVAVTAPAETPGASDVNAGSSLDERVEKAKQLISGKKEEKMKEELEKEKTTERERRRVGHEIHKARQHRQEQEMREALEERKKNSAEDAAARKKVLDQIAQDRAERLKREKKRASENSQPSTTNQQQAPFPTSASDGDVARLQFRLPSGETRNQVFPSTTTLHEIRQFIDSNITLPFREYQIATTFPRREFTWRDNDQNLQALHLLPSSVLLILPVHGAVVSRTNGWTNAMVAFFWSIVTPLLSIPNYISSMIFGGNSQTGANRPGRQSPTTATGPSAQPSQQQSFGSRTTVRRRGNIHTLADDSDSKDENNTWNGNSTQQM